MINPWKVFETNINSRPLLKWLDPRSFCKASPAQESHRLQSGTCFSSSSCGFSQFTTNAKICSFASEDLCKCLNTSGTQADVEVGLVICPKTWKPIWNSLEYMNWKRLFKKTSDIIRSLPWKDAEKKTKQQTSKPSGVTIKFTTVHWADTWQTSHYWQGWWAIGIPVANSPNESENCGTFKWKQMFPAGFWPLGGSAGSPAWIEDKVGTSHHTKFAQPNVLCNLEKSLPKTDWYRLIFNCRFLSTFSIFLWVPNSSKPSDYWTHLIETQFT